MIQTILITRPDLPVTLWFSSILQQMFQKMIQIPQVRALEATMLVCSP